MKLRELHYGWVMVLVTACTLAIYGLTFYSFGVFLMPLTTEFNWDRGALSVAVSINMLVAGGLGPIAGKLSDKYGPRILVTLNGLLAGIAFLLLSQISSLWQVYLIWGLLVAVASSCCWTPIVSATPRWFVKKRGIAIGLVSAGWGVSGVIGPILAQWLISAYDWRQAYIVLGLITFVTIVPLAQFMKHSPERMGLMPYGGSGNVREGESLAATAEGISLKQAIKTSHFWLFGLILVCFFFCLQVIIVHIISYAVDVRIPATIAASTLSIIGVGSVIGRLFMGFVSARIRSKLALTACLAAATIALILLLFTKEVWILYVFAIIFGLAQGGIIPLLTIITAELFGLKSLGIILGSLTFLGMIGSALGAPLAGIIFDVRGSYSLAFLICVVLCALATILSLVLLRSEGKRSSLKEIK